MAICGLSIQRHFVLNPIHDDLSSLMERMQDSSVHAQKFSFLTLLVPGDFSALVYGEGGVHPPLKSDFSPKKGAFLGPEIKFGIIRALN